VKDPDHYLTFREVDLPCAVYPTRKAQLIPALRARVNHEIFYFSGAEARSKFMKDPARYCGYVTDPISTRRFRPTAKSPRFEFDGHPYFFQSDSTMKKFKDEPQLFAERSGG
jgi:YHS domain-containing protein